MNKTTIKLISLACILSVLFSSCKKESDVGMELLPTEDLINVRTTIISDDISSYIIKEEPLALQSSTNLLGVFSDPQFGKTSVDFAAHYRPTSYKNFGSNPVVDSVQLKLVYKQFYGDTLTPQALKVYEIINDLNVDSVYNEDIDLTQFAKEELIGSTLFTPKKEIKAKSSATATDTLVSQIISIPIKKEIGERLISIDSTVVTDVDEFLKVFKGFLIRSEKVDEAQGALISLLNNYTALVVYYNNDENKAKDEDDRKTLSYAYSVTGFSARVNSYKHDYSGTNFVNQIGSDQKSKLIYIQPTFGLKSKIEIDGLSNWKDSTNIAINKAELIFRIDTIRSEMDKFLPPPQLLLTAINDDGKEYLPKDYAFSPSYYGGVIYTDTCYHFNITQHVQEILDNDEVNNNGFYLATSQKTGVANRVVLKGSESSNGIKMIITYSKFAQ